jgi:SARP family transcriptional regulator, regulator of embCAB operon
MLADSKVSRLQIGWHPVAPTLRVYLAGEVIVEGRDRLLAQKALPGPQARHLLAFLAAEHTRAIGHDELADELWNGSPPRACAASLKALASRVRAALKAAGFDGAGLLVGAPGVYRFRLPERGWVDLDAARSATHDAETQLAAGDLDSAARGAFVARLITARPVLAGRTGPWLERCRAGLLDLRIRSLECSALALIAGGASAGAVRDARLALELAPLREPGWRLLMDAHAAAGDTASALEAFGQCQLALRAALGVGPSAATRDRHLALLAEAG